MGGRLGGGAEMWLGERCVCRWTTSRGVFNIVSEEGKCAFSTLQEIGPVGAYIPQRELWPFFIIDLDYLQLYSKHALLLLGWYFFKLIYLMYPCWCNVFIII